MHVIGQGENNGLHNGKPELMSLIVHLVVVVSGAITFLRHYGREMPADGV